LKRKIKCDPAKFITRADLPLKAPKPVGYVEPEPRGEMELGEIDEQGYWHLVPVKSEQEVRRE
jgi:hypothetical protein